MQAHGTVSGRTGVALCLAVVGAVHLFAPDACYAETSAKEAAVTMRSYELPYCQTVTMKSKIFNTNRKFHLYIPEGYGEKDSKPIPTLYVTDGDLSFPFFAPMIEELAAYNFIPSMMVVGILYTNRNANLNIGLREDGSFEPSPFIRHLKEELIPYMEKKHSASPYRAYFGHSLGGMFGARLFVEEPDLFQAMIWGSPIVSKEWAEQVAAKMKDVRFRKPHSLYIYVGDELGAGDPLLWKAAQLIAHRGLDLHYEIILDEHHGSVRHARARNAIRWTFCDFNAMGELINKPLDEQITHYKRLDEKYGTETGMPQSHYVIAGRHCLELGDKKGAIDAARKGLKVNPANWGCLQILQELGEELAPE